MTTLFARVIRNWKNRTCWRLLVWIMLLKFTDWFSNRFWTYVMGNPAFAIALICFCFLYWKFKELLLTMNARSTLWVWWLSQPMELIINDYVIIWINIIYYDTCSALFWGKVQYQQKPETEEKKEPCNSVENRYKICFFTCQ